MDFIDFADIVSLVSTIPHYNIAQLTIRLHLTTMQMWPIVTDRLAWCVCLPICRSVCDNLEPWKTAEPIEMAFGMWTRVGPRNHVSDGGPDLPVRKGNFEEETLPARQMAE